LAGSSTTNRSLPRSPCRNGRLSLQARLAPYSGKRGLGLAWPACTAFDHGGLPERWNKWGAWAGRSQLAGLPCRLQVTEAGTEAEPVAAGGPPPPRAPTKTGKRLRPNRLPTRCWTWLGSTRPQGARTGRRALAKAGSKGVDLGAQPKLRPAAKRDSEKAAWPRMETGGNGCRRRPSDPRKTLSARQIPGPARFQLAQVRAKTSRLFPASALHRPPPGWEEKPGSE